MTVTIRPCVSVTAARVAPFSAAAAFAQTPLSRKQERGSRVAAAGFVWALVGGGAAPGPLVWGRLADWIDARSLLIGVLAALALSSAAPVPWRRRLAGAPAMAVSGAACVGIAAVSITRTCDAVGSVVPPAAIGLLTVCRAAGQTAGSVIAGTSAQVSGSPALSLISSAVAVVSAGLLWPRIAGAPATREPAWLAAGGWAG